MMPGLFELSDALGVDGTRIFLELVRLDRAQMEKGSQILLDIRESGLNETEKLALAYTAGLVQGARRTFNDPEGAFRCHRAIAGLTEIPDQALETVLKEAMKELV